LKTTRAERENKQMSSIANASAAPAAIRYYRHRLPVRLMHWINVVCLTILVMSGFGIFNAHPSLYWGASSYTGRPAFLEITYRTRADAPPLPQQASAGDGAKEEEAEEEDEKEPAADVKASVPAPAAVAVAPSKAARTEKIVILRAFGQEWETTAFSGDSDKVNTLAFPSWMTIPGAYSLADARAWHFFFAWLFIINGLLYVLYAAISGHLKRDLAPDTQDLRGIGASIRDHLRFKHPSGEAAKRYNVLQKIAYLVVIFILLPLIILMGMAMSPMLDTVITGWVDWFGGRQSARSIHFIVAWLLIAFVLIHVFEVIVSGLWNHLRSMINGYFIIKPDAPNQASETK
jgi:thiosulfate reductase cytochrome b subunit